MQVDRAGRRKLARLVAGILPMASLVITVTSSGPAGASTSSSSSTASPGITATTVTVGQVSDISKPVPGLFKAAEVGTQAYFDYVNSQGGINGRKLVLDARDSNFDTANVVSDTEAQAKSDFALVGGYSLLDQAEAPIINQAKMPDITYPLSNQLANDSNVYSPSPSTTNDQPTGPYLWAKDTFKNEYKHVGVIYPAATPSTTEAFNVFQKTMTSLGFDILYHRGFSALETQFSSDVLKMKSDGVSMYYDAELPGSYAATQAQESAQQGFHPTDIQGVAAYVDNMQKLSGGAADGMYLVMQNVLYEGEDAHSVPEVSLLDKWAKKVDPSVFSLTTPLPALDGWASGMLFAQALKAAGKDPTRASLVAQLNKVTAFDAGGLLPPGENPAQNIPSKCFIVAQFKNGGWARVNPTPKTGFICSGSLKPQPGFKPQTR
jgi:ABC-type branched-subunit amino acid transport system substrate-binding protein